MEPLQQVSTYQLSVGPLPTLDRRPVQRHPPFPLSFHLLSSPVAPFLAGNGSGVSSRRGGGAGTTGSLPEASVQAVHCRLFQSRGHARPHTCDAGTSTLHQPRVPPHPTPQWSPFLGRWLCDSAPALLRRCDQRKRVMGRLFQLLRPECREIEAIF